MLGKLKNESAKMTRQITCMMVKNWIDLEKIQSWNLDLEAIAFEGKDSISFVFKVIIKFLSACYLTVK